ncbi:GlxA family transcriptional regulator [Gallibacterium melopsittaci]|uniref:GlxA family transcriptional regulator n=1 Tax=Gallibacterium melopsittaci TaxID=516063 RepID=A0ABV6HYQ3_9PAST
MLPTVALILYPELSPFHFSVPYMIFSIELDGKKLFNLKIVGEDLADSDPSDRLIVKTDGGLELLAQADIVIVSGWHQLDYAPSSNLQHALHQAYQRGATIVGLCYGAYPVAYTGLLDGKKATTHWLAENDFRQRFPQIHLDINSIYIEQDRLITSAGTAAGLDCCLAIVRTYYGVKVANRVARLLVIPPHREGGQAQFIEQPIARKTPSENMNQLLSSIQENLSDSYHIDVLAKRLMMSRSSFTRHFRKATGLAFNQWLIESRLQRGRELLESTHLTVEEIAEKIGFHSATSFRQHFKQRHQVTPKQWQKRFLV